MPTKRSLNRQLADARAQIRRLTEQRDDARSDAGTEHFGTRYLAKQLDDVREENEELRRQLATAAPGPGPGRIAWARIRQELRLSERARASLDAQLLQLGQTNERLNREAYERSEATR